MRNAFVEFPTFASIASIALFALCLFGDGYYISGSDPRAWASAYALLLMGWAGLFAGVFTWLANPALMLAWFFFFIKKSELSMAMSIVSIGIMVAFLFKKFIISSEAPTYSQIVGYGVGFWLWIASAAMQAIASASVVVRRART
jgi:hypothetical protein